jgi:hypothetical protein
MFKSLPMPGVKLPQPDSEEEDGEEDNTPLPPGVRRKVLQGTKKG